MGIAEHQIDLEREKSMQKYFRIGIVFLALGSFQSAHAFGSATCQSNTSAGACNGVIGEVLMAHGDINFGFTINGVKFHVKGGAVNGKEIISHLLACYAAKIPVEIRYDATGSSNTVSIIGGDSGPWAFCWSVHSKK
jgi:hypothetical protein